MSFQGTSFFIGPRVVLPGMVVHLDTANPKSYPGSGSIVNDVSSQGIKANATFTGGHTITTEGIYLDGVTGNAFIPQPSITFASGGTLQQWTIGFFVKPDNDAGYLISPVSSGADHALILNGGSGSMKYQVTEANDVNNRFLTSPGGSVPLTNIWTYVVCTLTGVEMKIYINGKFSVARTNDRPIANWSGSWRIGTRAIFAGNYYRGMFQNIHVYNRELTPQEIFQNFLAFRGRYPNLRYFEQKP